MGILRGVENGYAIVRTARQGELTISDHMGKVLYEADCTNSTGAVLTGKFPLVTTKTIYSQFGDWFGYLIAITAMILILLRLKRQNIPRSEH
jgi:apolipoprotein N-acyltransferase